MTNRKMKYQKGDFVTIRRGVENPSLRALIGEIGEIVHVHSDFSYPYKVRFAKNKLLSTPFSYQGELNLREDELELSGVEVSWQKSDWDLM